MALTVLERLSLLRECEGIIARLEGGESLSVLERLDLLQKAADILKRLGEDVPDRTGTAKPEPDAEGTLPDH